MNKQSIYGFAFRGANISSHVLDKLKDIDRNDLLCGVDSINAYLKLLLINQPENILGMGVYTGVDQDKIRIESVCTNKFRNNFITGTELQKIKIDSFLKPDVESKIAKGIGNSYCNYVSYQIMSAIEIGELKSNYTFLHIPKNFDQTRAFKIIREMIIRFRENYDRKIY